MPRIDRILMLDHPGPLRRFAWPLAPADLPNFRRYNLVYGLNGSGKTSISRVLRGVETKCMPSGCAVEIEVAGRRIRSDGPNVDTIAIRVFNAEFVAASVISAGRAGVPPIFVFGAHSVNLQSDIKRLQQTLDTLRARRDSTQRQQEAAERELDSLCRREARGIKQQLSSAGQNSYNNYNKSHYRTTAERVSAPTTSERQRLTDHERRSFMTQCLSVPKATIALLPDQFPSISELAEEANELLRKSVVSTVIRELEADPSVASWVFSGLGLHLAREGDSCLFCGQNLPQARLDQLRAHFSTAYVALNDAIERKAESFRREMARIGSVAVPGREVFYESIAEDAGAAIDRCKYELERYRTEIHSLLEALQDKKERMFESYEISLDLDDANPPSIAALTDLITRHNAISDEFDRRTREARARLEEEFISENLGHYRRLKRRSVETLSSLQEIEPKVSKLAAEIRDKEQSILEHRRPAAELNQELHLCLGHGELQFAVKDSGYEISRNGVVAESLSEGEKTAISLLYFLKSLESRDFNLSEGVVVLDDPVSSLDANALYAACGFVRDRARGAGQVFVFTHNFSFFREMRRWMSSPALSENSSFYMLETSFEHGERFSCLRELDPLLRDYESDYHYLFCRIYWHVHGGATSTMEENYAMPNMARRLLERFFAFCRAEARPGHP